MADDTNFVTSDELKSLVESTMRSVWKELSAESSATQQRQFDALRQEFSQKAEDSLSWIDELIEEAEDYDGGYYTEEEDSDDAEYDEYDDEDDSAIAEMQGALNRMSDDLEAERQARVDAENRTYYSNLINGAVDAIAKTGKVRNPKQLLGLLIDDEYVTDDEDGNFVVTIKDEYGMSQTVPFVDALDNFLSMPDYEHFAAPRAGSGTGAEPGGMEIPAPDIAERLLNPANIQSASPEDFSKMLSQLDKAARGVR